MSIRENYAAFMNELADSAAACGRNLSGITVMAVSKTRSAREVVQAREAGLTLFGENRVEEASEKFAPLEKQQYPLYLIGHLQSNKVNRVDGRYAGVHSVDSLKLAAKLSKNRLEKDGPLEILIQVNTSGEASKSGFGEKTEFLEAAERIGAMPGFKLRGLMTMAPFVDDESVVRSCFAACREWSESLKPLIGTDPILSMGMSSDYRWAVAEGSTLLRIGTALFGGRG